MRGRAQNLSDLTSKCIRCGFCLESCPTYAETGLETYSPRGRIHLVRSALEREVTWPDIEDAIDTCLGCRACETACPSGVQYGHILEAARERLTETSPDPKANRLLSTATHPALFRLAVLAGQIAPPPIASWIADTSPPELQQPGTWPPMEGLPPIKGEIALLEGCAMPVLFARVREATIRLLRRCGYEFRLASGCCGALHGHQGHAAEAAEMVRLIESQIGDSLLVADVAGCGSWLKESLPNVMDVSEFLIHSGLAEYLRQCQPVHVTIAYHDACHLAHGQGIREEPRQLLAAIPGVELVPLTESEMCCGSAGIYSFLQPDLATRLRDRKWDRIRRTGAQALVLGNAGCQSWLDQAAPHGIQVMHTVEVLEAAFSGWPD